MRAHGSNTFESLHRRKDGTLFPVEIANTYLEYQGNGFAITFVRDISNRRRAEDTHAQLEQQLLQFQKMESIGRLAGGVAHDFNNLLTVIQGYCDLMAEEIPSGSALLEELRQIRLASQRAATLTRQLLAFSRKQILSPVVFGLNDLVVNVCRMLDRVIGEDIALRTTLEPELRAVIADPGQIEQVIMNLVINARDAMPTVSPESHDWIGWSLNHLGHAAQLRREYSRAEQLHQRTLAVFIERLSDKSTGVMWAYQGLGETALGQGDPATARQWLHAALDLSRELGAQIMIAWCLAGLGSVAALDEATERAARLWGAAAQLRTVLGCRPAPAARSTYERLLAQVRVQLGEGAFAAAWAAGEALSLEQAITEALGDT